MAEAASRRASYDDLCRLPPHVVGELIAGELFASPRPGPRHARAASRLGGALDGPFDRGRGGPGGWIILPEPELHMGGDVLVPDWAGWRRERMPALPDTAAFELAPDWVCEIVSPTTERVDRARKLPLYARHGVSHAWLINPLSRTLEVYELRERSWVLLDIFAGEQVARPAPFAAVELELAALWED